MEPAAYRSGDAVQNDRMGRARLWTIVRSAADQALDALLCRITASPPGFTRLEECLFIRAFHRWCDRARVLPVVSRLCAGACSCRYAKCPLAGWIGRAAQLDSNDDACATGCSTSTELVEPDRPFASGPGG